MRPGNAISRQLADELRRAAHLVESGQLDGELNISAQVSQLTAEPSSRQVVAYHWSFTGMQLK